MADFGLAVLRYRASSGVSASTKRREKELADSYRGGGTPLYMAPELRDNPIGTFATDVYAFGIMMVSTSPLLWLPLYQNIHSSWATAAQNEILCEVRPYSKDLPRLVGPHAILIHARNGNRPPLAKGMPKSVTSMIQQCWDADPKKRPSFAQLMKTMTSDPTFRIPDRI